MGRFSPKELEYPDQLRLRFIRLWGDLLQLRSHRQLQELMEASSEAAGE